MDEGAEKGPTNPYARAGGARLLPFCVPGVQGW